jgi:hypothetical protein
VRKTFIGEEFKENYRQDINQSLSSIREESKGGYSITETSSDFYSSPEDSKSNPKKKKKKAIEFVHRKMGRILKNKKVTKTFNLGGYDDGDDTVRNTMNIKTPLLP